MSMTKEPILNIPQSVKEDTFAYRSRVDKFLSGETTPVSFKD